MAVHLAGARDLSLISARFAANSESRVQIRFLKANSVKSRQLREPGKGAVRGGLFYHGRNSEGHHFCHVNEK